MFSKIMCVFHKLFNLINNWIWYSCSRKQSGSNLIHLLEDEDAEVNGSQDLQDVNFENLDKAVIEGNMEDWL